MTGAHWAVIGLLALAAFVIRVAGLIAGGRIRASRHAWILEALPGLIVVSLVASSLAGEPTATWIAAALALGVAVLTNHVIATMVLGVAAFATLQGLGL
ncbi:branched-chain amino acid transporter [Pararhodobacter marinus]|uniref:Branched-chain amino acid transporter n=1 Tax=Pararhodobacter marinus TaxID=2184063 RepID=A0A2U2C6I1_9RHOB|nr:AzlD domain-containing protein [Pararhodobacter marinus]PWE27498.1 branched-chain amino acid transporter [Pararhodobacter marinus]